MSYTRVKYFCLLLFGQGLNETVRPDLFECDVCVLPITDRETMIDTDSVYYDRIKI